MEKVDNVRIDNRSKTVDNYRLRTYGKAFVEGSIHDGTTNTFGTDSDDFRYVVGVSNYWLHKATGVDDV